MASVPSPRLCAPSPLQRGTNTRSLQAAGGGAGQAGRGGAGGAGQAERGGAGGAVKDFRGPWAYCHVSPPPAALPGESPCRAPAAPTPPSQGRPVPRRTCGPLGGKAPRSRSLTHMAQLPSLRRARGGGCSQCSQTLPLVPREPNARDLTHDRESSPSPSAKAGPS